MCSIDRLLAFGIRENDAKELRRLGIRLRHLDAILAREATSGNADSPLSHNEIKFLRLLSQMRAVLGQYPDLTLVESDCGGFAVARHSELLAAWENGGLDAYPHVPTAVLGWR